MSTDAERRGLYDALVASLGSRPAGTLTSGLLFPGDRAEPARQSDLLALRGDFTSCVVSSPGCAVSSASCAVRSGR